MNTSSTSSTTKAPDLITSTVDISIWSVITTLATALFEGRLRVDELVMGCVLHRDGCDGTEWPSSVCTCGRILAFDTATQLVRVLPDGTVIRTPVAEGSAREH